VDGQESERGAGNDGVVSDFEIRPLGPEDDALNRVLMNHAFARGGVITPPAEPPKAEEQADEVKNTIGAFEGGKLRASLTTLPFDVHWGAAGTTLAMGGIAGVATFAEARGRGMVDALLRRALEDMRAAGQTISALFPFAWGFYRRAGWDWVGRQMSVTVPLAELRSAPEGRRVEQVVGTPEEVRAALSPAYSAFAARYRGMFTTNSHRWDRSLRHDDKRTTHAYAQAGSEGYLLWRFDGGGDSASVREFVATTPDEHRALLSLLHYFGTQCKTARLCLPADSPLWSHVMHWDLQTKLSPVFMGRVVDFTGAVARLTAAGVPDGACTLSIRDEHAPWNDGLWRLASEGGRAEVSPVLGGGAAPDVALEIQALSQALWGTPSLTELRAAGRIEVHSEAAFTLLSALLPASPVFTLDDF
jgi:predicted acetyltransferase